MRSVAGRIVMGEVEMTAAAARLAEKLHSFSPTRIIYIQTGGALLGESIAHLLGVPAQGIDIRYPFSRIPSAMLRFALFPAKELIYKLTTPSIQEGRDLNLDPANRIALIDDTASTGKTLRLALHALLSCGVSRSRIRTAVLRRGRRAASVVDFFDTEKPVILGK